jgi:hypothetical protein
VHSALFYAQLLAAAVDHQNMLTLDQAKALALASLPDMSAAGLDLVIIDERTIAKPYGFIFFYNSRQYLETRSFESSIAWNGPVVVRHDGTVDPLPSAAPSTHMIAEFESRHGLSTDDP